MRWLRTASLVARASLVALALAACGAPAAPGSPAKPSARTVATAATPATLSATSSPASASAASRKPPPDVAAIYTRLESGLARCCEVGRKATPEMTDGKLTLNASIDSSGKATCVIPSDHTGLTQDVEDCMSARFAAETFDAAGDRAAFDSVETVRMPDAFDVLEGLEPALQACMRSSDARAGSGVRGLLVAARVGADGRPLCALASSTGPLPPSVGECASAVLRNAKFPPPKRGSGIVLVPINVIGSSSLSSSSH